MVSRCFCRVSLVLAAALFSPLSSPGTAAAQVALNALVGETQRVSAEPMLLRLIWWIPVDFWRMSLESQPEVTPAQTDSLIEILQRHTVVAVVSGRVGQFGNVRYDPPQELRANIRFIDMAGNSHRPVAEKEISKEEQQVLGVLRPIFSNMLGQMGQNLELILFPPTDSTGHPLADPRKVGSFSIVVYEEKFAWRLPLGSLLPQKRCPVDGELLSGAWNYCPIHGDRLVDLDQ